MAQHEPTERRELVFALLSGASWGLALLSTVIIPGAALPLFIVAYVFGGWYPLKESWESLRQGHLEVDALMVLAAIGAALIDKWAEGAVLLFLFSLGHALEERALGRAKRSINALSEIVPTTATVLRGGQTLQVPVAELRPGEVVVIAPHTRVPADAVVIAGTSSIDQSALTGESIPVMKEPAEGVANPSSSQVFAGTINGEGALHVEVTASAEDSTLAQIAKLIEESEGAKSGTQLFLERFERIYTPLVLVLVFSVFATTFWAMNWAFSDAYYLAMTILVAASPCALAVAVPSAVLAGIARGAKAGILFKGGAPLQALGQVKALAFDKTGTLTWGEPRVVSLVELQPNLVEVLSAVQADSDHPLARAIQRDLGRSRVAAEDVHALVGRGLEGTVENKRTLVGSRSLFGEENIALSSEVSQIEADLAARGETTMIVWQDGDFLGVAGLMDTPRLEGRALVEQMRSDSLQRTVIVSGDRQPVVDAVGSLIGVDVATGELMPRDKAVVITQLATEHGAVAMVGDGVNDAPALAGAEVGIALGAAGSAVALETCDVALMNDDLGRLPFAFRLSRATNRIIRQNLFLSIASVVALVVLSLWGAAVGPVVAAHECMTLVVALNSLRLLRFDVGREHVGIEHETCPTAVDAPPPSTSK